jgi:hypothetical protein
MTQNSNLIQIYNFHSKEVFMYVFTVKGKKGKAIPVTGREGPYGCETLRLPHFLNRLTDGGKVVSLTRRPPFTSPGRFLVLISVRG